MPADQEKSYQDGMKRVIIILAAIAVLGVGWYLGSSLLIANRWDSSTAMRGAALVRIGNVAVPVEVAVSDAERSRGLSGRESLAAGQGMLFVFPEPGFHRFWMPEMRFAIDIIWIADGAVAGIEENVPPESNPANPRFYAPPEPVRHVLEVKAGFARERGIGVGDAVVSQNILPP